MDEVRKSVEVQVPVERAWTVFTEEIGSWWPLVTHSISAEDDAVPDSVVLEGHAGGVIYETIGDDRRQWGVVAVWEPPTRIAVDWSVGGGVVTRWTATFSPTASGTRVDLVHVGFQAHGDRASELLESYGSDQGWTLVLGRFAATADASS